MGIKWLGGNIRHKYEMTTFYLAVYLHRAISTPLHLTRLKSLHARITSIIYLIAASTDHMAENIFWCSFRRTCEILIRSRGSGKSDISRHLHYMYTTSPSCLASVA
jgi:hypothetical protein